MSPINDLSQAWQGWAQIVAGKDGAGRFFSPTLAGLGIALFWLAIAVLLATAVQSVGVGMPSLDQILLGLFAQALTLAFLALAIWQSLYFLKIALPVTALLVPVIYAMALVFILAIPLTLANAGWIALLGLTFLIYRAGRTLAGMRKGVAIALALLCLMVLVIVPYALYIVFLQTPSPAS